MFEMLLKRVLQFDTEKTELFFIDEIQHLAQTYSKNTPNFPSLKKSNFFKMIEEKWTSRSLIFALEASTVERRNHKL